MREEDKWMECARIAAPSTREGVLEQDVRDMA